MGEHEADDLPADSGGGWAPSEQVCSEAFRTSATWQALGDAEQEALRQGCNEWKLQQLDQEIGAG